MDDRRPPTPDDMPSSLTSASTLTDNNYQSTKSTTNNSSSSTKSSNNSFDRALTTQTLAQLREEWDYQHNSDLLQRKHHFFQYWGHEFIPQEAVDDFILHEAEMKSGYDHWVEEESAMYTKFDNGSMVGLPGLGAEEMSSPGFGEGLIPSKLFTPERNTFLGDKHHSIIAGLEKTISSLKGENQMLNEHIQILDRQHAVSLATNSVIEQLQNQLARVEEQLNALQVNGLNQSQKSDIQTRDASKNDIDLLGRSFTGKCALIEKILGVDITTTGPKPGNLLELLHNRLWHIEAALLLPHSPNYRGRQPYLPLTEFVKPGCTAAHRTVNYSVPPGQMAPSFPYIANSGPSQHSMPAGYTNGNTLHAIMDPPPPPSLPVPKPKFETQDVRCQLTQPPRATHRKSPHPLQHDPAIPKGPKAKTPDPQSQESSRVSSAEWPALGADLSQARPKSSNSRASSSNGSGQRKQCATKPLKEDMIMRPQSAPYGWRAPYESARAPQPAYLKVPAQHQHHLPPHHQDPAQRPAPAQFQQTLQHPSPQKEGASLKAFLQVPGGFDGASAPVKKQNGMCGDENCDFC